MRPVPTEAEVFAAVTPEPGLPSRTEVSARIACPETGGIKRVRMGLDPVMGVPEVTRCGRFGAGPVTCAQRCLILALPD